MPHQAAFDQISNYYETTGGPRPWESIRDILLKLY